jgi:CBS domain-containing protein
MMVDSDCGAIPVVESETQRVIGMVTDRDIVCRLVARGMNPVGISAEEIMTMPVIAVEPETDLKSCLAQMEARQVRRLPVVDGAGNLCGMVSQADVARVAGAEDTADLIKTVSKPSDHSSKVQ